MRRSAEGRVLGMVHPPQCGARRTMPSENLWTFKIMQIGIFQCFLASFVSFWGRKDTLVSPQYFYRGRVGNCLLTLMIDASVYRRAFC